MKNLEYKRVRFGEDLVDYPTNLKDALTELDRDFWAGACAQGIVLDHDNGIGYVMVDSEAFDKYRDDYNIVEIG